MATITADNVPTSLVANVLPFPIAASIQLWQYDWVATNSGGYLVRASDTSGLVLQGVNNLPNSVCNNTGGGNGALTTEVSLSGLENNNVLWIFTTSANVLQNAVGTLFYFSNNSTGTQTVSSSASNLVAGLCVQYLNATTIVVNTSRRSTT